MFFVILAVALLNLCAASEESQRSHHIEIENHNRNYGLAKKLAQHNLTYVDKDENMLRVPTLNKFFTERKSNKKPKKSPKRTIQKIIKKNTGKLRKVYFNQIKTQSTVQPKVDSEKMYSPDAVKKSKGETTTKAQHKHRYKSNKVVRYHMPFQKLQKKQENMRHKRGLSRELFILKDLDQIEFLSQEKDNDDNVIKAHITNYWKV